MKRVFTAGTAAALLLAGCASPRPALSPTPVPPEPVIATTVAVGSEQPAASPSTGSADENPIVPEDPAPTGSATTTAVPTPGTSTTTTTAPATTAAPTTTTTTTAPAVADAPDDDQGASPPEVLPDLDESEFDDIDALLAEIDDVLADLTAGWTTTEGDVTP